MSKMSVNVSYKKQFSFGFLYILIILVIVEGIVQVIEINANENCLFIQSDVYDNLDKNQLNEMCKHYREVKGEYNEYLQLVPNQSSNTVNINNFGFRGSDFDLQKQENTVRIFMVGGSTTFGSGSTSDNTSIPGFLQEKFERVGSDFHIEIINAGSPGAYSKTETLFVQDIILQFDPDMILIYDGWNDAHISYKSHLDERGTEGFLYDSANEIKKILPFYKTPTFIRGQVMNFVQSDSSISLTSDEMEKKIELWTQRWDTFCKSNLEKDFEIFIFVQPLLGSGEKPLSDYEKRIFNSTEYPIIEATSMKSFVNNFSEFQYCTNFADLTNSFDDYSETIFFDRGHMGNKGNFIISEKIYEIVSPHITKYK